MNIKVGDHILVDTTPYAVAGAHWCDVVDINSGDASPWQFRVQVPGKGIGQYRREEIMDHHPATGKRSRR